MRLFKTTEHRPNCAAAAAAVLMPYLRLRLVYSAPATFLCDSVTLIFATPNNNNNNNIIAY